MPSQKRARQRAARQARQQVVERRNRRRSTFRRTVVIVVLAALAVGIYIAVKPANKPTAATTTTTTTTTTTPVATSVPDVTTTTVSLAGDTTSANCPTPYTATTKLKKASFSAAPPMIIDTSKTYTATVTTDVGVFTIALDAKTATKTVNNFVFLAENHFYDCVVFHRVIPSFMDQTGDPTGTGSGGPGYEYTDAGPATASPQYPIGSVAMANSSPQGDTDPSTNGSQFFVVTGSEGEGLPPDYVLFGQVTSGLSVVDKINADGNSSPSSNGVPPKVLHRMISVQISSS